MKNGKNTHKECFLFYTEKEVINNILSKGVFRMRVKVHARKQGIPQFEFGKTYYVAYAGATIGDLFVFTRKKTIEMFSLYPDTSKKEYGYRISKRELKQLVNSASIHFIGEVELKEKDS